MRLLSLRHPAEEKIHARIGHQPYPHATSHAFDRRFNEPHVDASLRLQDHGNAIQHRNIWVVPGK
jgi:hypothetical protein